MSRNCRVGRRSLADSQVGVDDVVVEVYAPVAGGGGGGGDLEGSQKLKAVMVVAHQRAPVQQSCQGRTRGRGIWADILAQKHPY